MTVDLSKLQAGDTVHFRCGGEAVVCRNYYDEDEIKHEIKFSAVDRWAFYMNTGHWNASEDPHPFDIILIKPKPFDWKEVKPGMAFAQYADIFKYIGPFLSDNQLGWFEDEKCEPCIFVKNNGLTRAPEHDIEVAENENY